MEKLRAYYYPYSIVPRETLKALALYFDEIVVHAFTHFDSDELDMIENSPTLDAFREKMPEVYENPNGIGLFGEGFDALWVYMVGRYSLSRFLSDTRVLQDEGILVVEDSAGFSVQVDSEAFESLSENILGGIETEVELDHLAGKAIAYSWITRLFLDDCHDKPINHESVREVARTVLAFQYAFAFSNAESHVATPLTDNQQAQELMDHVVKNCTRSLTASSHPAVLGFSILQSRLPSLYLHSYDDVLEARSKLNDELLEFREKIQELSSFIRSDGIEGSAGAEALNIQAQINNKVNAIERKVRRARSKFFRRLAQGIATASPPALISTFYPNTPIGALAVATSLASARTVYDAWADYRDSLEEFNDEPHGVTYLLKLQSVL